MIKLNPLKSEMVRQTGRDNQPPYRQYVPNTEIQYRPPRGYTDMQKPSRIFSEREAHMEFQSRPHTIDTDTIADAVFADAVSKSSSRRRKTVATRGQDLLRSLWRVLGGVFRSCPPNFSEVAFMRKSPDATHLKMILRQLLRSFGSEPQKLLQKSALRCILLLSVLFS